MPILAAFMVPHPPMIVPQVGRGSEKQIERTTKAYQQVAAETGVSSATICRVKKCLDYGSGGYRRAIDRAGAADARG